MISAFITALDTFVFLRLQRATRPNDSFLKLVSNLSYQLFLCLVDVIFPVVYSPLGLFWIYYSHRWSLWGTSASQDRFLHSMKFIYYVIQHFIAGFK